MPQTTSSKLKTEKSSKGTIKTTLPERMWTTMLVKAVCVKLGVDYELLDSVDVNVITENGSTTIEITM